VSETKSDTDGSEPEIEITEFSGCTVAHLPDNGDAWITGWVDVPR
jgi:hypothetical protein